MTGVSHKCQFLWRSQYQTREATEMSRAACYCLAQQSREPILIVFVQWLLGVSWMEMSYLQPGQNPFLSAPTYVTGFPVFTV